MLEDEACDRGKTLLEGTPEEAGKLIETLPLPVGQVPA
jgi:hypothetical protein